MLTSPALANADPVFIIGSGRSGTTLLRRVLMAGGGLYIPPETYFLGGLVKAWPTACALGWRAQIHLVLGAFGASPDADVFPRADLHRLEVSLRDAPPEERSLATILDALFRAWATADGWPTGLPWGDKTPINTLHLELIAALFPRARYVHVLRDPHDVVASLLAAGRYPTAHAAAERWVQAVAAALRQVNAVGPKRATTLRYEDFVRDPFGEGERLCSWLGIPFGRESLSPDVAARMGDVTKHAHHARVLKVIDAASIGRGADLCPADRRVVDGLIAPLLGFVDIQVY